MTLDDRYAFLRRLSADAGALALGWFRRRGALDVEEKGPTDYVSEADRAVERVIADAIAHAFPGDAFLGEETANTLDGVPERLWVVDPIDGTHNFLRGVPYWNVSIAFLERGERALGAICDPCAGAVYHAQRGTGAWRTDAAGETRLAASRRTRLPGGMVCVGHHDRAPDERYMTLRRALMERNVAFRNFGCAALQLAHVAEGRYDAYVEMALSSWDAMAGLLLVEEAGGFAAPFPGSAKLTERAKVVACGRGLSAELMGLVDAA
ncbi:MAG: inositol monophosphatase [Betaproteobacteria bacterium]|nr:MAG: inositol monophosphatase [Betaproteobacteria bacterium]